VVINERRQNYENRPYGLAGIAVATALYPDAHPYHWPTIGYTPDLRAASLDDVRGFFARYYHPANASIALAGDIEPARALDLVRHYFAEVPAGEGVGPVSVPPGGLTSEVRLMLEDRVELPRLYLAWRSPALFAEGDAALDVLADVLANGKTSRLYRLLVHERRLALDVSAAQQSRELEGLFQIAATAAPGHTLAEIDAVIMETLGGAAADGPSAEELARALAQAEAHFVYRLQTVGGFSGKSDQLNAYNVYRADPGYFGDDLGRYLRLTAHDVREAARALAASPRVALSVVPTGRTALALSGSATAVAS
jgi:zinc protease